MCLRLLVHWLRRAASRAAWTAGSRRAIRTAMMAMTTSSSINVNPRRRIMGIIPVERRGTGRPRDAREDDANPGRETSVRGEEPGRGLRIVWENGEGLRKHGA